MQVTETLSEGLKREFRIVVPAADVRDRIDARLDELGRDTPIRGFRPGKAPRALLRARFGDKVRREVVAETVDESWRQTLIDRGLKPALAPDLDVVRGEDGADLEYTLALETMPEFELADVKGMKLERLTAEPSESRVDAAVSELAERDKTYKPAEEGRAAALGDAVQVDFEGRIDGAPFAGGSGKDMRLRLGSGVFLPGFEDGLVGAAKGETREVEAAIPGDHPNGALAGKTAAFSVTVREVLAPEDTEIDDAFAKRLGMADLGALRAAVREQGRREYRSAARARLKRQILDKLAAAHDFAVPAGLVDNEFRSIWRQIEQDMESAGKTWGEPGLDEEAAREDYRGIAERRVRLGLVLSEIAARNEIAVPMEEINRAAMAQARLFPGKEKEVFEALRTDPEAMGRLRGPLLEDKVIDFIVEMADVTERAASPEELLADPDDGADAADGANEAEAGHARPA